LNDFVDRHVCRILAHVEKCRGLLFLMRSCTRSDVNAKEESNNRLWPFQVTSIGN
jgi:hypothetical protein